MQFAEINFNCNLYAAVVALFVVLVASLVVVLLIVVVISLGYHCRIFLGQLCVGIY